MPDRPVGPTGLDRLELPCLWIPNGDTGPRPASMGFDQLEIPAIWIPDGYEGPRPGYPWIEFGRMTLATEPARMAGRAGRTARANTDSPQYASGKTVAVATADRVAPAVAPRGPRQVPANLPDLRATLAAFETVSEAHSTLMSLSRGTEQARDAVAAASPTVTFEPDRPQPAPASAPSEDSPASVGEPDTSAGARTRLGPGVQMAQAQLAVPLMVEGAQILSDALAIISGLILGAKPPENPQPIANPPQSPPPIPEGWVGSPTRSGGA